MTDPIADFLTRVRNAIHAAHETVEIPASKQKSELARILDEQGYIDSWSVIPAPDGNAGQLIQIRLKYTEDRRSAISGLRRVSRRGGGHTSTRRASRRCWAAWAPRSSRPRMA